jgi:hypothetical protein
MISAVGAACASDEQQLAEFNAMCGMFEAKASEAGLPIDIQLPMEDEAGAEDSDRNEPIGLGARA